jgi:hypothetical protein
MRSYFSGFRDSIKQSRQRFGDDSSQTFDQSWEQAHGALTFDLLVRLSDDASDSFDDTCKD